MAGRDLLDHDVLAPFSSRMSRSRFNRAAENIAYGHADFASALTQWTNWRDIALICSSTARSGSASHMHKMVAECIGHWSSAGK